MIRQGRRRRDRRATMSSDVTRGSAWGLAGARESVRRSLRRSPAGRRTSPFPLSVGPTGEGSDALGEHVEGRLRSVLVRTPATSRRVRRRDGGLPRPRRARRPTNWSSGATPGSTGRSRIRGCSGQHRCGASGFERIDFIVIHPILEHPSDVMKRPTSQGARRAVSHDEVRDPRTTKRHRLYRPSRRLKPGSGRPPRPLVGRRQVVLVIGKSFLATGRRAKDLLIGDPIVDCRRMVSFDRSDRLPSQGRHRQLPDRQRHVHRRIG
jgi:hypothetical protein